MDRSARNGWNSRALRVESLESRALLASDLTGLAHGLATARSHHDLPPAVAAHVGSSTAGVVATAQAVTANVQASQQTILIAHLAAVDSSVAGGGAAVLHISTVRGQTNAQLGIELEGAAANSTFNVSLKPLTGDATAIGTITTDASGKGSLVLTTKSGNVPVDLTKVSAGYSITVSTPDSTGTGADTPVYSGEFAAVGKGKPSLPVSVQPVNLKATLSDVSGAKAVVVYNSVTVRGKTHTELEVVVTGAAANASLPVTIHDQLVGTITTDAAGRGVLRLTTASAQAGDTITVGTMSSTFTKVGKK
jgi:hypothetical protein